MEANGINKDKLTLQGQIKHMEEKGIQFNEISIQDSKELLSKVNYYFKVTSYRSNFVKNAGKYQNLDFAYLVDLASIDMQLRGYLLDLSLDIEHGIKVALLELISNDSSEDGYTIVDDFKRDHAKQYVQTMEYFGKNKYLQDMYGKHHDSPAIWVFLEIMTFGTLSLFVDFYLNRTNTRRVRKIHNFLKYSKNIRNACAHSNPLLVNLFSDREFLRRPSAPVRTAAQDIGIQNDYLQDIKINDLVSLFYLHRDLQSVEMGKHREKQGKQIIDRFHRHNEWYANNTRLNTFFALLDKLIDYLSI